MDYKNTVKIMLNQGLIKKQKVDFSHIEALLLRAHKDIVAAKANLEIDEEVTYNYAYLAMLRCGRSIVFMKGYRSVNGQQHKTIIELSGEILGEEFKSIVKKFDHMRRKRNQFTYDPFLPVSKIEAENALKTAEEFVTIVLKIVQKENPQLRLSFND
ncbi:HEPN domain-containing protein [bacterium]|nr:HEPN domain-containing protein [bacterium]MBU4601870.1 HEPN domain-containing protein [bacterium]